MTTNTFHTLNDYRLSTDSVYEGGSHSKLGAGALVVAIFLGVGAYFFYPMIDRNGIDRSGIDTSGIDTSGIDRSMDRRIDTAPKAELFQPPLSDAMPSTPSSPGMQTTAMADAAIPEALNSAATAPAVAPLSTVKPGALPVQAPAPSRTAATAARAPSAQVSKTSAQPSIQPAPMATASSAAMMSSQPVTAEQNSEARNEAPNAEAVEAPAAAAEPTADFLVEESAVTEGGTSN